jgi:hypothetical protein
MKLKLLLATLLLSTTAFAAGFVRFGVGVGPVWGGYGYGPHYGGYAIVAPPPAPLVSPYYAAPAPGYSWIGGYWYPNGARWVWRQGYWERPPYAGAFWVGPRYYGGRYYRGYWGRRR